MIELTYHGLRYIASRSNILAVLLTGYSHSLFGRHFVALAKAKKKIDNLLVLYTSN